jgi:hypothetical protein
MIEAVNSVISNAAFTKPVMEQQSVMSSYAANPQRVQVAAQAPFLSLYIHVDVNFDKAVLQMRDSDTGDVLKQIPTERQLESYKRAQTTEPSSYTREKEGASSPIYDVPNVEAKSSAPVETSAPLPTTSYTPAATSATFSAQTSSIATVV